MKYTFLLMMAGSFLLFIFGCDSSMEEKPAYATTVPVLSNFRLQVLRSEFQAQHGGRICTPLNKYGFTEWSLAPCLSRTYARPTSTNVDSLVKAAKAFLLEFSTFTGVTDTSLLDVRLVQRHLLRFHHQRYQGFEVKGTEIILRADANGFFAVGGNWYPEIALPDKDRVSLLAAQQQLVGQELTYSDFGGQPRTFRITADSFPEQDSPDKVILPVVLEDRIELRIAWRIKVGIPLSWNIYVDTSTGEQLEIEQLFNT